MQKKFSQHGSSIKIGSRNIFAIIIGRTARLTTGFITVVKVKIWAN